MDKNFNTITSKAKTFSLSKEERQLILQKVSAFIKENPIAEPESELAQYEKMLHRAVAPLSILWRNKITLLILSVFNFDRIRGDSDQ